MAWVLYDNMILLQHNGGAIDFDTDTINCMLVTSAYTPNKATHDYRDDLGATEVSGSGYSAGGAALAAKSVALSTAVVTFDAGDVTWSQDAGGFADAKYAVLYKSTASTATDGLIAYADIGSSKGNVSGDLTLEMSASGIFTATN